MRRSAKMSKEVRLLLGFQTLDTRNKFSTTALLDCGATDSFIDYGMIKKYDLKVESMEPVAVYNADGQCNKLGDINGYVDIEMTFGDHKEIM
jgi:hypothetical protein